MSIIIGGVVGASSMRISSEEHAFFVAFRVGGPALRHRRPRCESGGELLRQIGFVYGLDQLACGAQGPACTGPNAADCGLDAHHDDADLMRSPILSSAPNLSWHRANASASVPQATMCSRMDAFKRAIRGVPMRALLVLMLVLIPDRISSIPRGHARHHERERNCGGYRAHLYVASMRSY
jgi:hypothetical protein